MNKKLLILSLPCMLSIMPISGRAEIRVGNHSRSYADDHNQITTMQQIQPQTVTTIENLPIRVADKNLAEKLSRGDITNINIETLESCKNIYPGGDFAWDRPTAGLKSGNSSTCVAMVEMRAVKGTEDIILARANVAAGDVFECNISKFPESGYTTDAGNILFPADKEPTIDDVKKVMDEEQKKNAGIKIAAGAVVGGLLGNAAGKNDLGEYDLIGTSSGKLKGSAIGALTGAALMTGNSYAGKVGGDMIMSAGVNAAAGAVVGNMIGSGDSVLRIEDCTDTNGNKTKCLWGVIEKSEALKTNETGFYNIDTAETMVCDSAYANCEQKRLIGIVFEDYDSVEEGVNDSGFAKFRSAAYRNKYTYKDKTMTLGYTNDSDGMWVYVESAKHPKGRINAMILDFEDKFFGSKMSDWREWDKLNIEIFGRDNTGQPTETLSESIDDFYPITVDASDGGLIDINNKARLKSTRRGMQVGSALGSFTAYQGANDEIEARWVAAVQSYKDSLQKIYCATGTRFLSSYNDITPIPEMK